MKDAVGKYQKLILCVGIAVVILGGVYYFGILHAFVPNSEDLGGTQRWYMILHYGQSYQHGRDGNLIQAGLYCLSVLIGGMSFFSVRLYFTFCYMMILGGSLYLSIHSKDIRKMQWYLMPLWAFFMIFVHTINSGSDFGKVLGPLAYQLPYAYHNAPIISALGCVILLQCWLYAKTKRLKAIIGVIGMAAIGYSMLYTDLVYYVIFVAPVFIALMIRGLYNDNTRKYVGQALLAGMAVVLLTRILPGGLFQELWGSDKFVGQYDGVYGATSWLDLDSIMLHITNYIKMIMMLFNIDLSNRELLSFYSLLFIVRIIFIFIGYAITAKIIVCSIKGKRKYPVTDEILAWAFVMLSCVGAFTKHGLNEDCIRYFAALVPTLTILLCRNIIEFITNSLPIITKIQNPKRYYVGMLCVMCICQAEPVWRYEEEDCYLQDCEAAIDYIRQWGGEYAVASYWLAARLSAMTKGEILFFQDVYSIKAVYGDDATVNYIVVGWEEGAWFREGLEAIAYGSYEEMCEKYQEPVRAVDLDYFYVCEFKD